jgi:hypothetical protein
MSKNANYIYPPFVMSNDINLGEGLNFFIFFFFLPFSPERRGWGMRSKGSRG